MKGGYYTSVTPVNSIIKKREDVIVGPAVFIHMLHSLTIYFFSQWVVGYVILLLSLLASFVCLVPTWQIGWGLGYQHIDLTPCGLSTEPPWAFSQCGGLKAAFQEF